MAPTPARQKTLGFHKKVWRFLFNVNPEFFVPPPFGWENCKWREYCMIDSMINLVSFNLFTHMKILFLYFAKVYYLTSYQLKLGHILYFQLLVNNKCKLSNFRESHFNFVFWHTAMQIILLYILSLSWLITQSNMQIIFFVLFSNKYKI